VDPNTGKGGKGPLWEGTKNFTGRREREGRNGNGKQFGNGGCIKGLFYRGRSKTSTA